MWEASKQYSVTRSAAKLAKPAYGSTSATDFGPKRLKEFREQLIRQDYTRQYINDVAKRLRMMFKWAASEEMIPGEIVVNLATVQGLKKKRTSKAREAVEIPPVDDHVVLATIEYLSKRVADMVRVHRLLGCRPTELCELKAVLIDRSADIWIYTPEHHKTEDRGNLRDIVVGPKAQAILKRYLLRSEDDWCFESGPGRCYSQDSYRRAVQRAAEKAFPLPTKWVRKQRESAKEWKLD